MNEEWKDIKGFEGYYQISNLGRIKSLERKINNNGCLGNNKEQHFKEKILKVSKNHKGYLIKSLRNQYKKQNCSIHRLVAEAFIPNPYNMPQVNHKDEDKTNNKVDNLEWCNNKYNVNYGSWKKKQRISHLNHPSLSKKVIQKDKDGNVINYFNSIAEARRKTNIKHIGSVANNIRKTAGGYKWEFVEGDI